MNSPSSSGNDPDRPGWFALLLPLIAFGFGVIVPIPFLIVGWDAVAMLLSTLGLIALPVSVILAIIVAVHSRRDRPSRRNRALGGALVGLLLTAFCLLALMEVNRKNAAMKRLLEESAMEGKSP